MAGPWTRVLSTAAEAAKAASREVMTPVENLLPWARAGREKDLRRVVVLGTGWGAARVARDLDLGRHSSMAAAPAALGCGRRGSYELGRGPAVLPRGAIEDEHLNIWMLQHNLEFRTFQLSNNFMFFCWAAASGS